MNWSKAAFITGLAVLLERCFEKVFDELDKEKTKGRAMPKLTFWTVKRRKRLAALAAKGLPAREIASRFATTKHAPTPQGVRDAARRFGIKLLKRGGRPRAKRKRGAEKRKDKRI